jgi:hypothetical protein
MSTRQLTYDADTIHEETLDVDLPEFEHEDDFDPAYVAVCRVVWLASTMLEDIRAHQEHGVDLSGVITQGYVDRLTEAFETGRRVVNHDGDELGDDLSTADADLLEALTWDVEPVARHFGIDVEFPTPEDAVDDSGGEPGR